MRGDGEGRARKLRETFPSSVASGLVWLAFTEEVKKQGEKLYVQQVKKIAMKEQIIKERKAEQLNEERRALEAAALLPEGEMLKRGLQEVLSKKGGKFSYDQMQEVVEFAKLLK